MCQCFAYTKRFRPSLSSSNFSSFCIVFALLLPISIKHAGQNGDASSSSPFYNNTFPFLYFFLLLLFPTLSLITAHQSILIVTSLFITSKRVRLRRESFF
ncbi:Protein CBG26856 [Caenorhabditis briggsae]|uniref:Protein CBG26856 n=1 Tax=Caenorhabditis briggsae TaxID=6238 RepID=B6II57_CAEBR|nr:Protein CBG26856 [Caenorhabditis briggsae]CAR99587.1 Protein CBG26856 [Caenorhabditis briggsae]